MLPLLIILTINFAISWWNSYAVGKSWAESKAVGGWLRVVTWAGAVMAALGFSSVYLFALAGGLHALGQIDTALFKLIVDLWYVTAILPLLASGLILTLESWRHWWRERSLVNLGVSAWNTYTQVHNSLGAIESMGDALGGVLDALSCLFSSDDDAATALSKLGVILALLVALVSLLAGALHAALLIQKYAATDPLPALAERQSA